MPPLERTESWLDMLHPTSCDDENASVLGELPVKAVKAKDCFQRFCQLVFKEIIEVVLNDKREPMRGDQ